MKTLLFVVLASVLALTAAVFVPPRPGHKKQALLGSKECTYGPAYWCQNLTNAADCHATKHCIDTVWIHRQYPEDKTSICDTCKEMVKEARDQLESNETQELIKEVFEGSCALLRLKPVVQECDKIADEYIPDLIDTLASQMNPQVVCAVAGLCNSPRVQELLTEAGETVPIKPSEVAVRNRCDDCNTVLDIVVSKFKSTNPNDFLESLLEVCGKLSSFSDSCSNIIVKYFPDIYSFLHDNFNAADFCLLSGECHANFHKHQVEITPMSKIGYVQVANEKDDLPCELCEQLVTHLREVLVANTTEAEFKQVLEGICKQTGQFKDECLSIVNQYYSMIYNFLVDNLNATVTCQLIKVCPQKIQRTNFIAPLLPVDTVDAALKLNQQSEHVYIPKDDIVVKVIQPQQETVLSAQDMQLPIDLLVPAHQQVYNQQFCVFCEYFLHYVQSAITNPKVEDEIKEVIDKACSKLPRSINETCVEFVNTYEPALVALLAQEIDPSQICPMINACPKEEVKDVEIFLHTSSSGDCPLCLYAITELEKMINGDKSKDKIKEALNKVCSHLPGHLRPECVDFVNTYTDELVEMMIKDFKPQEVCVFLKMCTDSKPAPEITEDSKEEENYGWDVETNLIFDDTIDGHPVDKLGDEKCILCEFIMKQIDDELKDKKTDDELKALVHSVCKMLPGTIKDSCNKFIDQYADAIILLLQSAMEPQSICTYMKMCDKPQHPLEFIREEVSKCGVCRSAAEIMKTILKNPNVDQNINHLFEKTCRGMPLDMKQTCESITNENGIALISQFARGETRPDSICRSLSYCSSSDHLLIVN